MSFLQSKSLVNVKYPIRMRMKVMRICLHFIKKYQQLRFDLLKLEEGLHLDQDFEWKDHSRSVTLLAGCCSFG